MADIFDVANWFLKKSTMKHKKLQKLCYYAKAWSLVLCENDGFDAEFEAWAHGPVCRSLWIELKDYGYNYIPSDELEARAFDIPEGELIDVLEDVWDTYGEYTGYQLEKLSHSEDPWIIAREGVEELAPSDNVISDESMVDYYSSIYSGDQLSE